MGWHIFNVLLIGPNILRSKKLSALSQSEGEMQIIKRVISFIIENFSQLFKKDSPYDENVHGYEKSAHDEHKIRGMHVKEKMKIDMHELRSELTRLRLSHRKQQAIWMKRLQDKETEKRRLEQELSMFKDHHKQLSEDVHNLQSKVQELEIELEKTVHGESSIEQYQHNRDKRQLQDDLLQLDRLTRYYHLLVNI